ncbi:MAG: AEC family transporter [Candidatus Bipolaricaulota bacterium]
MLANALLPVFLVTGVGWVLRKSLRLDPAPLAQVTFWCLSPALIFDSLRTADLPLSTAWLVVGFAVAYHVAMLLLSLPVRRALLPGDRDGQAVASLTMMFGNCGNLGLPVLLLALGRTGFEVGVIFLAANSVLVSTLGIATITWEGRVAWRRMLRTVLRVPWIYAVAGAVVVRMAGELPTWLANASELLAGGAIPVMVLLLGMQLADVRPRQVAKEASTLAALRLLLGTLVAWGLAAALGVTGAVRGALIVEGSVPTAVNSLILSLQYNRRPDLAASVLLLSTAMSAVSLSLVLHFLTG